MPVKRAFMLTTVTFVSDINISIAKNNSVPKSKKLEKKTLVLFTRTSETHNILRPIDNETNY